jgi:hypothetical protein
VLHVELAGDQPACIGCGGRPKMKDRDLAGLADLPCFGRTPRLVWHKVRWSCPDPDCEVKTWTWADPRIAAPRRAMTDRTTRWVTEQVGRLGRPRPSWPRSWVVTGTPSRKRWWPTAACWSTIPTGSGG